MAKHTLVLANFTASLSLYHFIQTLTAETHSPVVEATSDSEGRSVEAATASVNNPVTDAEATCVDNTTGAADV